MSVAVLLRNEAIKMSRYRPFRVAIVFFAGLMLATYFGAHVLAGRTMAGPLFDLPAAWTVILGPQRTLASLLAGLMVVLLTANEFTWRTARQNVIDGLSKEEWFLGKLLIIPIIATVLFVCVVPTGVAIALIGDDPAAAGPLVRGSDVRSMGNFLFTMLGYGTLALFLSTTVRGTGSTLGIFFLYAMVIENLLALALRLYDRRLESITDYLPVAVLNRGASLVALVWILVFVGLGFTLFRYRDV